MTLDAPYDASSLPQLTPETLFAMIGHPGGATPGRKLYCAADATLEGPSLRGHFISNTDRNKGHVAESAFAAAARSAGFEVYQLPHFSHNYLGHVDFELEWPSTGQTVYVDVKAPRSLRRGRDTKDPLNCPQSQYACIELAPGGSLFGSKAHLVAYQLAPASASGGPVGAALAGPFVIVDRLHSVDVIKKHIESPEFLQGGRAAWPEQSLWAPYVRSWEGVHVPLMYVELRNLKPFATLPIS